MKNRELWGSGREEAGKSTAGVGFFRAAREYFFQLPSSEGLDGWFSKICFFSNIPVFPTFADSFSGRGAIRYRDH
jgi:hypothetical protein